MNYTLRDLPTSVQENMDAQVTVKVPARAGRKAYKYTKNTSGAGGGKRKANVGLGVGLAVGSAAILGGLAATAAAKKGDRDADGKRNSEAALAAAQKSKESIKVLKEKVEQQRAEYEAKTSRETPEQLEAARKRSADLQERMKKPIETAEESDAKRRTAGAKAIAENESAKAQASAEEKKRVAEAKRKKDEEIRQKDEEYRNSSEYKAAVKSYPSRAREQAKASDEYQLEKFANKAGRDLKKEGAKGKGKKSGGGFAKRSNSLYERIDAFINRLRCA